MTHDPVKPETDSPAAAAEAVERFLDAIWMERGLSKNTLAAYRADLMALARWLSQQNVSLVDATRSHLLDFIAWRVESGARPRSTARQLSSFRRFFRYLVREGRRSDDPTAKIQMPKIGRTLPKSLERGRSRVAPEGAGDGRSARLPRPHDARGALRHRPARHRADQPEVLAGEPQPGRRAHQAAKATKERLIPLGEQSVDWLQRFTDGPRGEILLERQTDYLFPTRRGERMTRQAFWHIIKRYARTAGVEQGPVAAHAAPCLRDAPAQPRRRPARRADAARPQRPVDDADLHARRARASEGAARGAPSARLIARRRATDPPRASRPARHSARAHPTARSSGKLC